MAPILQVGQWAKLPALSQTQCYPGGWGEKITLSKKIKKICSFSLKSVSSLVQGPCYCEGVSKLCSNGFEPGSFPNMLTSSLYRFKDQSVPKNEKVGGNLADKGVSGVAS